MYSFIHHIKFLLRATNQHGVHSPFVYSYVTKCLYSKKKYASTKSADVLLKSIDYFKIKSLKINSESELYKHQIKKRFPGLNTNTSTYDAIYMNDCLTWDKEIEKKEIKNTSWVFIKSIHHSKESSSQWNNIIALDEVTVSIDLFYCGVLFFRREQEKEHFKIRY
ncbi:hypothetical protein [uncultured Maribacter sp.]|uniref:hypothetical protein n=1 Tax=uncultured Maribacter sp. TaxID=431308 RepID=UPI00260F84D6|nr:hypothetical protein [uncultured Maribacter sp.]